MGAAKHTINWFEIPVRDINRACQFYNKVFGIKMKAEQMGPTKAGIFPNEGGHDVVHGALIEQKGFKPSRDGTLIYLNGGEDLAKPLGKVEDAGGKIVSPKKHIGQYGYMAIFEDSEGNRLALHSMH